MQKLAVRPMQKEDIPLLVKYWSENSDESLERMGIDKSAFMTKKQCEQYFIDECNKPFDKKNSFYMIWLIDNESVGHNGLNEIISGEIANLHLHMWNHKHRGKGFGAKLFCMSVIELYKLFNLKMILCEPRSTNSMPNKMLEKIGYKKWKTYVSKSCEMGLICELNSYIIDEKTSVNFLK